MGGKRKALAAAVLALAGTAVTVPMVVSGIANAQENARVCGVHWNTKVEVSTKEEERGKVLKADEVWKIYEVPKGDKRLCDAAQANQVLTGFPLQDMLKQKFDDPASKWDEFVTSSPMTCEHLAFIIGTTEGGRRNLESVGDGFPSLLDQKDICKNMETRSLSTTSMQSYWLYSSEATDDIGKPAFITRGAIENRIP